MVALLFHVSVGTFMIYMNNMQHGHLTRMALFRDMISVACLSIGAVYAARRGKHDHHRDLMVRAFIISVEGAGTIRFAVMVMGLLTNFLAEDVKPYFEMGYCYNESATTTTGMNAYYCQGPYLLRLLALRLVSHYHQAMYLRVP